MARSSVQAFAVFVKAVQKRKVFNSIKIDLIMIGNMNHTTVKLELMMKRIILFVLLAISATATIAQTNPKPGYIITTGCRFSGYFL